jgi:ankyrin repeat protein
LYSLDTNHNSRFLLARLHIDSFLDETRKKEVHIKLKSLDSGDLGLEEAYKDAVERINGQSDNKRVLARQVLSWISYAERPLTIDELCHVLAVEPGQEVLDSDNIPYIEDIVAVRAGLVTIDEESKIIRLVHHTTQEYFERTRLRWNPIAQEEIAMTCLSYLSLSQFRTGSCSNDKLFKERRTANSFLDYAARYWAKHIHPVQQIECISEAALAFLRDENLMSSCMQALSAGNPLYSRYSQKFPDRTTGVHMSARFGLYFLLEQIVERSILNADLKDGYSRTPLIWAAMKGHKSIVKLLTDRSDVVADFSDWYDQTALSWAAMNGHEAGVKLLSDRQDVSADSKDGYDQTPLSCAAMNGHEAVVKLLIDRPDVEADSRSGYDQTPLSYAAEEGHESVVELLIDRQDVEIDSRSLNGRTPLLYASWYGHDGIVKLLINRNADVNLGENSGRTPLSYAAWSGRENVVKLLLDHNAEVDSRDANGRTPLSYAAADGHRQVAKLLIDQNASLDSKSISRRTPLSYAAECGSEPVVSLLLYHNAEIGLTDDDGRTPLSYAKEKQHKAVIELLA